MQDELREPDFAGRLGDLSGWEPALDDLPELCLERLQPSFMVFGLLRAKLVRQALDELLKVRALEEALPAFSFSLSLWIEDIFRPR